MPTNRNTSRKPLAAAAALVAVAALVAALLAGGGSDTAAPADDPEEQRGGGGFEPDVPDEAFEPVLDENGVIVNEDDRPESNNVVDEEGSETLKKILGKGGADASKFQEPAPLPGETAEPTPWNPNPQPVPEPGDRTQTHPPTGDPAGTQPDAYKPKHPAGSVPQSVNDNEVSYSEVASVLSCPDSQAHYMDLARSMGLTLSNVNDPTTNAYSNGSWSFQATNDDINGFVTCALINDGSWLVDWQMVKK